MEKDELQDSFKQLTEKLSGIRQAIQGMPFEKSDPCQLTGMIDSLLADMQAQNLDMQNRYLQEENAALRLESASALRNGNNAEPEIRESQCMELNELASELLDKQDMMSIYHAIVNVLRKHFSDTLILYVSIDEKMNNSKLEVSAGMEHVFFGKALDIIGYNPVGSHFRLVPNHDSYFRSGKFVNFSGDLQAFAADEFPKFASLALQKLIGLHKIYTIGINKDDELLAAIHFFTFNKKEIRESSFIEALVKLAGIVIQKKNAEYALRESEEKYRLLVDNTAETITLMDLSLKYTFVSPSVFNLRGFSAEEALAQTLLESTTPESVNRAFQLLQEELALEATGTADPGRTRSIELEQYCKNGSTIWVENTVKFLRDQTGAVTSILAVSKDISERKSAENSLHESENRFRALTENSLTGIYILDNNLFRYINPAFAEIFGYRSEELTGADMLSICHPDDHERIRKNLQFRIDHDVDSMKYEFKGRRKNGEIIDVMVLGGIAMLGNHPCIIGNLLDITEQKRSQDKLRLSLSHTKALINANPDMMFVFDPDGTIVDFHFEKKDSLYADPGLFIGKKPEDILPPDLAKMATEKVRQVLRTGQIDLIEYSLEIKGELRYFEARGVPFGDGQMLSIVRDITVSKRSEIILRENEQRMQILFDTMSEGLALNEIIYDEAGEMVDYRVLKINNSFCTITGLTPEEVLGKTATSLYGMSTEMIRGFWKAQKKNNATKFTEMPAPNSGRWFLVATSPFEGQTFVTTFLDITDRKMAVEELINNQERFRQVAECSGVWVWEVDKNGLYTYVSPTEETILGYTPEELVGRKFFYDFFTPESKELLKNAALEVFSRKEMLRDFANANFRKDGQRVILKTSGLPILDSKGDLLGYRGADIDVTSHKKAVELLQASEEKFSTVFMNAPVLLTISEFATGRYIDVNQRFLQVSGFSRDEVIGKTSVEIGWLKKEDRLMMVKAFTENQRVTELEIELRKKNGEMVSCLFNGELLLIEDNVYILSLALDITESKVVARALKNSEYMLAEAERISNTGSWEYDISTATSRWSENMFKIYDADKESNPESDLNSLSIRVLYAEDRDRVISAFMLAIEGFSDYNIEYRITWRDGSIHWIHAIAQTIKDSAGKPSRVIGWVKDITHRKASEQDLITAKEKAEESDQLKTAFLNNISHEIRTPLHAIINFTDFLKDPNLNIEKHSYYTGILEKSSYQLLGVINDIVNISTIDAGQEEIYEKEFNLNTLMNHLHDQFLPKAKNQQVSLQYSCELPDTEALLLADESKLKQILTHLIGNAIKFTLQGTVEFSYKIKSGFLEFYVTDTGIGIDPSMHQEIFKRFRQVEINANRRFGGSGLGLSLSKAYVEMQGGKIWVNSEPEKGSAFTFTLPYRKVISTITPKKQILNAESGHTTPWVMLIAEDEDFNYRLLFELLSRKGIQVIRAMNGAEALAICESEQHLDLVLMDIKMPVMDGYEATRRIKRIRPQLTIVAQTAYSTDEDKEKAMECGCSGFLGKPFKPQHLFFTIGEFLPDFNFLQKG